MKKEFSGKKLLILGGIKLACDIVRHAQDLGAFVIVADYYENSPAKQIADKAVLIDATDVDALVKFCKEEKIDGVTTGFVDILMPVCYEVCKRLGLPYYATEKMLSMSTNKVDFKETCKECGVPVPNTYYIGNEIPDEIYGEINYPVFVKPLDSSGSRGAGVCNNVEELKKQFNEAVGFSPTDNAIIEDYITGREFLLDYIAVDGEFRLMAIFDRYVCSDRGSAINYANVSICPSAATEFYYKNINDKIISMFKQVGFRDGLMFLQGHYDGKKITFYEMGCRLGGSFYNLEQECLGYNPVDMIIRYALAGKMVYDINTVSEKAAYFDKFALSYNYLLTGEDETIACIEGLEEIKNLPNVVATIVGAVEGMHFGTDRTVDKPALTIHFVADTKEQMIDTINYMNEVYDVKNEKGKSLLMNKFDPSDLVC